MSYKFSTGSLRQGDIYYEDDRLGEPTYIDFGMDTITLRPSGSQILHAQADAIGIGTTSPGELLTINGAESNSDETFIHFQEDGADRAKVGINTSNNLILHNQHTNKHIVFKVNDQGVTREALRIDGAVSEVVVNQSSESLVDFRVESNNNTHMLFVDGSTDKVGINTDAPNSGLHVNTSVTFAGKAVTQNYTVLATDHMIFANATNGNITLTLPSADGTAGQAMVTDASGNLSFAAAGATVSQDNSSNTAFNLYFASTTSGALTAVNYDGGTLTFNPSSETLIVTNASTTASQAKYADLAEKYAADEEIEAGTVVMFIGEGKLAPCNIENHVGVAGIVSTNPGYLMNSALEGGVALALAGRVPTKVTGVVQAGDLMVAAANGMAMANNSPAIGTVIGKAIEANEGGDGVIEVLALMM